MDGFDNHLLARMNATSRILVRWLSLYDFNDCSRSRWDDTSTKRGELAESVDLTIPHYLYGMQQARHVVRPS